MNGFLEILQNMNTSATKPEQLLSRQASRRYKTRENRFGATQNQLHRHDREDEARDRGAYRYRGQQPKREHDYAEGMPAQGRCQPANGDVFCGCLTYDFLQHPGAQRAAFRVGPDALSWPLSVFPFLYEAAIDGKIFVRHPPCRKPLLEAPPDGTAREPR